ncbi:GNAT family N-acetyltransferase [Ancylobacter sp. 6x-1]|uniref:GNAT family N-acetyltransferase n=1 Tax=Ancylobacter crimeensis TaxID=2579147 RepID=A0ABT0DDL3_9HYPH|nr:GNAT family N-acetyltransferase [Ancylobacter crimeensis]MCK0198055.1 GNAT family N-acetyltransferase [Ancylobacter crimeensis]
MPSVALARNARPATRQPLPRVSLLPGQVRPVLSGEFHQYVEHMLRLDAQSRLTRFGGPTSDEVVRRHGERMRAGGVELIGYFVEGVLRGVGELHMLDVPAGQPVSAEAAFSVEREWQGKGIGSLLMDRIVSLAQDRGVEDLAIIFLATNGRMQRIVVNHYGELTRAEDEMIGHVHLPRRQSAMSFIRHLVTASLAVVDSAIDLQSRMLPPAERGN